MFPDFPTFGYIFVVRCCIGLHVWVRAYCWIHVFLKYIFTDALNFEKPLAPMEERRGHGDGCASSLFLSYDVQQICSLGPCTDAVHGAAGHNRWGVAETPLLVKTQGRNVGRSCNF